MTEADTSADRLARAYVEDRGRVLAALIGQFRDFSLAEDAVQEAFLRAADRWAADGIPDNPAAWLMVVARRVILDRLRKASRQGAEGMARAVADALVPEAREAEEMIDEIPDDRLRLIFTCCHPALAREAQVALTLRALGGLTVAEIARAFLVGHDAMARRLTRAKTKIREAGIPYVVPAGTELPGRASAVLEVIYLIYNESYAATEGPTLTRGDLAEEAIRLAALVQGLLPLPETQGLLALLLSHDARRAARVSGGVMVPLEAQDRGAWDREKAEAGHRHLMRALAKGRPGPYQLQAAISATHNRAGSWEATDWREIAGLYAALEAMTPGPVVRLNRAVALAYAGEVATAGEMIDGLEGVLAEYQPFHAARAEVRMMAGDAEGAIADLAAAIARTSNGAEAAFLAAKREAWVARQQGAMGRQ